MKNKKNHGGRNICLELFNLKKDTEKWNTALENACTPQQVEMSLEDADSKEERNLQLEDRKLVVFLFLWVSRERDLKK